MQLLAWATIPLLYLLYTNECIDGSVADDYKRWGHIHMKKHVAQEGRWFMLYVSVVLGINKGR